jgi:octaprenyl-diphosphate synthase
MIINPALEKNILEKIRALVSNDLNAADKLIRKELFSDVPLIQQITEHIIKGHGKRLRPLLVILSAKALNPCCNENPQYLELAVIIEFVHTATLLHDDVVDASSLRRGEQTANALWGNPASVLVGDFLYSRAFQLLAERNHPQIMKVLSQTTNAIAEGEVMQLMHRNNPALTEANYVEMIYRKTAKLFEASAEIGAILGSSDPALQKAMAQYGLNLGLAFQIVDDLLDYTASSFEMGKNAGDDLGEGKATLPLIYAIQHSSKEDAELLQKALRNGELKQLSNILKILEKTKALEYSLDKARQYFEKAVFALKEIPESPYQEALLALARFAIERKY